MSIRPVDVMTMQRMNDVSQIKQNENAKPLQDQANFMNQLSKEVQHNSEQVVQKANVDNEQQKYDAKEKGKGEYAQDGKVKIKKKNGNQENLHDDVVIKGQNSFFDVSI